MQSVTISDWIKDSIDHHEIILFMKGSKSSPVCGFSAKVVNILNRYGVEYHTEDVLTNNDLREGIKIFSNWPTLPQLYVRGQFIGGCDIITELEKRGELSDILLNTP